MRRLLLLTTVVLAGATLSRAENPTESPAPKRDRPALTEDQRAQLEEKTNSAWNALSLHEKMQLLKVHRALRQLPPEERKFIQDRLERFWHMTAEERQKLRDNARRWRQMTAEQKEKARELYRLRRQQFEEKWQREHPGEQPPPVLGSAQAAPSPDTKATPPPPQPLEAPPATNQP